MAIAPIFKKAYWSLALVFGFYFLFVSLLINGWVQRQALYAHKIHTSWWQDPNKPEQFGFLKNQVQPFHISTPDGEILYGWHVLPIAFYLKHEATIVSSPSGHGETDSPTVALELLAADPDSRLIISFHGNAGTVAQGWRTDTYRTLASAAENAHVLTVDYRGFGHSSGSPNEKGLITDGIALVDWALRGSHLSPQRIVIQGQSLGTAVATAVSEYFAAERNIGFKALILIAAFSDIPTLMSTYALGGFLPILSPLRPYPMLQRLLAAKIQETWFTATRLANLVRKSVDLNLYLIHAANDLDIPWSHSNTLFEAAANATSERGLTVEQIDGVKSHQDLGEAGWINTWTARKPSGKIMINQQIIKYGGHNRVCTYDAVTKAVFNAFKN